MRAPCQSDKPLRLIVVDDYEDAARALSMLLRLEGFDVDCFQNGRDAIEVLTTMRPDAVLLDIAMPEISGWEIIEWMHRQPHLTGVPVIAVTGLGQPCDLARSEAAGFSSHLVKPVDGGQLCEAIQHACGQACRSRNDL